MKYVKYLTLAIFLITALELSPPVKAAEAAYERIQIIRLNKVMKLESNDIVGMGYAHVDNGRGQFGSGAYPGDIIEIHLDPKGGSFSNTCKNVLLNNDFPKQILGNGKFNSRADGATSYVGEAKLSNVIHVNLGKMLRSKS